MLRGERWGICITWIPNEKHLSLGWFERPWWVVILELPWPQPYSFNTQESVICAIHQAGVVLRDQGSRSEDKTLKYNVQWELIWGSTRNANLEIVLLGFASHDDVECLIWVFGATLNTAGHVLLILVWVQPHTERSVVSSQLGLWFRTYARVDDKIRPFSFFFFLNWQIRKEQVQSSTFERKIDMERGLSIAPIGFTRREPFCSFQIPWQIFFKQDTEREVKVNPTGLFCERLSGVCVGVCNCARVYGYVEMCQIPLLKWVWQSRYTLNTTGATMWTTGPRILEHESLYKSHSKVKTNIPHWSGLWQGMLYSSKGSWRLPPSTFWI